MTVIKRRRKSYSDVTKIEDIADKLLMLRNPDGGIPAGNDGDPSGPWTTAATLCTALSLQSLEESGICNILVHYLCNAYQRDPTGGGGWPNTTGPISTMSTGQASGALSRWIQESSMAAPELVTQAQQCVDGSVKWLLANQISENGGWCPGSRASGHGGPTIMATSYAMQGFNSQLETHRSAVRRGAAFLLSQQNTDSGGWCDPPEIGRHHTTETVSDTARAIIALVSSAGFRPDSAAVRAGIRYLETVGTNSRSLRTHKVSLHIAGSPSEVVVNKNTYCDLVIAYALAEEFESRVYARALRFLTKSVDRDLGLWNLADDEHEESITTWPSADWLIAMRAAADGDATPVWKRIRQLDRKPFLVTLGSSISIGIAIVLLWLDRHRVNSWWHHFAPTTRSIVLISVILTLFVGVVSAAAWDFVKALFRKWYNNH